MAKFDLIDLVAQKRTAHFPLRVNSNQENERLLSNARLHFSRKGKSTMKNEEMVALALEESEEEMSNDEIQEYVEENYGVRLSTGEISDYRYVIEHSEEAA